MLIFLFYEVQLSLLKLLLNEYIYRFYFLKVFCFISEDTKSKYTIFPNKYTKSKYNIFPVVLVHIEFYAYIFYLGVLVIPLMGLSNRNLDSGFSVIFYYQKCFSIYILLDLLALITSNQEISSSSIIFLLILNHFLRNYYLSHYKHYLSHYQNLVYFLNPLYFLPI